MILELDHIYKDYIQGSMVVPVLKDVTLHVEEGEYVAIMGPSGSGKSTLMNIIGCLDRPTKGTYSLDGMDVLAEKDGDLAEVRLKKLGFVFQTFQLLPRQTALDNVALPLIYAGVPKAERMKRAAAALDKVGLSDRMNFIPNQLSGGQKQRLSIARAIARNPEILIFDDSFSALDYKTDKELRRRLSTDLADTTCVIVAQRIGTIRHADKIIVLDDGKMAGIGTHEELMKNCEVYQEIALSQLSKAELA